MTPTAPASSPNLGCLGLLLRRFPLIVVAIPMLLVAGVGLVLKTIAPAGFRLPAPWIPLAAGAVVAAVLLGAGARRGGANALSMLAVVIAGVAGAMAVLGAFEPTLHADAVVLGALLVAGSAAGAGPAYAVQRALRRRAG